MGVCGVGPHCSFCGTSTGPFSEVEGLFTVLICIPCLAIRQAPRGELLGLHDPGQPWLQWGCPIDGCGRWVMGPWDLEGHTAAEHPDWTATYELLPALPEPAPAGRVPAQRSAAGELTLPVCRWGLLAFLDEAEGGSQPSQGRLLVRIELGHGPSRLPLRWLVASGPEVQAEPLQRSRTAPSLRPLLAVTLTNENALSRFRACPDPHPPPCGPQPAAHGPAGRISGRCLHSLGTRIRSDACIGGSG
jgi:hypothetical protein